MPLTSFTAPVVGMHFRPPAKVLLKYLPSGSPLTLTREPDNPYDMNAVMVFCCASDIPAQFQEEIESAAAPYGFSWDEIAAQEDWQLGYIAKEFAVHLAPLLDQTQPEEVTLSFNHENKRIANITMDLEVEGEENEN